MTWIDGHGVTHELTTPVPTGSAHGIRVTRCRLREGHQWIMWTHEMDPRHAGRDMDRVDCMACIARGAAE